MLRSRARQLSAAVTTAAMAVAATGALAFTAQAAPTPLPETAAKAKVLNWLAHKHSDTIPRSVREGADWTVYAHLYEFKTGKPGKKIGDATTHCSAVEATPQGVVAQCQSVLRTDQGSITMSGSMDVFGPGPYGGDAAVTGGTGTYAEAEGQAEVVIDDDYAKLRISLDD
ncbi:hypothetical protein ACWDZ4_26540 [Streptomyces sp. NPDC003016]